MEPPYSDENPNLSSVRDGLGVAEDEARNIVEETYETSADDEDDDSGDFIDDEDEVTGEEVPYAPELAAMRSGGENMPVDDFERENGDAPDEQVERAEEFDPAAEEDEV